MKVSNKQIAKALFFKFYYDYKDKEALKVAAGLLNGSALALSGSDADAGIRDEFEKCGCMFSDDDMFDGILNLNGETEMDNKIWDLMCEDIYK